MRFFYVGLAMRSRGHDYGAAHHALFGMRAQRVSRRIWLCAVHDVWADEAFDFLGRSLAKGDEMLVVELPPRRQPAHEMAEAA